MFGLPKSVQRKSLGLRHSRRSNDLQNIINNFYAMGATFDFYMYKDTENKGFLIPFLGFLLAIILSIVNMIIYLLK